MNKNNLILGRGLFTLIIIVSFGLIIMNEKGAEIFAPQIENKINTYLETNYNFLNIKKSSVKTNHNLFSMKITSKENPHLYFLVNYHKRKIQDTYQKDYKEGYTLLNYLKEKQEKEIEERTKEKVKVEPISSFDQYSASVQKKLLKEENLLSLKYYRIEKEFLLKDFTEENILKEMTQFIQKMTDNQITPNSYTITITNQNDIMNSIEIKNLKEEFLTSNEKENIIRDIINHENSELLKTNKITVKYNN